MDLVAITARTIAGTLVCCLRSEDRAAFYRDARAVLDAVRAMLDEEEQREAGALERAYDATRGRG